MIVSKYNLDWLNEFYTGYSISLILANLVQLFLIPMVVYSNIDHSDFAQNEMLKTGVILKNQDYNQTLNNIGTLSFLSYLIIAAIYFSITKDLFDSLGIVVSAFTFLELVNTKKNIETKKNIVREISYGGIAAGVSIIALVIVSDMNYKFENKYTWAYLAVFVFYVTRIFLQLIKRYILDELINHNSN